MSLKAGRFGWMTFLVYLTVGLLDTPHIYGQGAATGTIVGTVTDATAAVVPEATVTLTNQLTGISQSMQTNSVGRYEFTSLPIGTYTVRVEQAGFSTAEIPDIPLTVAARYAANVSLQLGEVTEVLEVAAQAPLMQTESNMISQVVDTQTLLEIPLNGRDYQQLQLLTPGVVSGFNFQTGEGLGGGASIGGPSRTSNIVNGMRPVSTSFLVDGGDASNQAFRTTQFVPPIDAVAEFNQISSNAPAQYGYGPTTVNVAIKSGTNEFHGSVWEFVRNKEFDARNFFAAKRDDLKRNQFGFSVGGPVVKDRAFFFFTYEGTRESSTSPTFATVPLDPWRSGDLSGTLGAPVGTDALGRPVLENQVFDPLTSRSVTNGTVREPFPGNIIPPTRINPASSFILNEFIPRPNTGGAFNNYAAAGVSTDNPDTVVIKLDTQLTDKDRIFFTGGDFIDGPPTSPGPYPPSNQGLVERKIPGKMGILGWTHIFSPTTVGEFRFSDSKAQGIFDGPAVDPERGAKDLISQLGIDPDIGGLPGHATTPGIPTVQITGFSGTSGLSHFPTGWRMNQMVWSANLSSLRGKHSLQVGYAAKYWKGGFFAQGDHRGFWQMNGTFTASPGSVPTSTNALGDFLLGVPFNSIRTAPWSWFYFSFWNHWWYFNDTYKVSPNLTLNFGLRYEINPWPIERRRQFALWSPDLREGRGAIVISDRKFVQPPFTELHPPTAAWVELLDSRGVLLTAQEAGLPGHLRAHDYNNFAPRVGFAWKARQNTVIRGGYGVYYIPIDLNRNMPETVMPPFLDRTTPLFNTSPIPAYNFQNSYCRSTQASFPGQCVQGDPFSFPAFPGLTGADGSARVSYAQQWNFTIQRNFATHWLLELAYVGNNAHKLEGQDLINHPLPGVGDIQSRRPFPEFGTITFHKNRFNSNYHAMQLKVQHEFASGFSLLTGYTWSKWIDDLTSDSSAPFNPTNLRLNKAVSDLDVPHRFTTAYVWDLPFPEQHDALRYLVNGWRLTGIFQVQSGYPLTPRFAGDVTNTGQETLPDRVCDGKLSNPTPQRWFDTSCFVAPAILPGTGGAVRNFGNSGRNILRTDRTLSFDLGLFKDFMISERFSAQLRFEAFNFFNTVSFGSPVLTVNIPSAGVVSTAGPPRIIQFGLKLVF